jgi:hypothetical protein
MISCWAPSKKWCYSSKTSMMVRNFFIMNLVVNIYRKKLMKTKINRVKMIFFSNLWKYDAYCKVKSIYLLYKMFGKVCVNLEWGNCEKNLEVSKGIISFNTLRKKLILLSQTSKKGHYWKIMGNAMLIKVSKSKKTLDISNKSWGSPINNHYKKSWFFKWFNLTKMFTLIKRMFILIKGVGHERHMVFKT